MGKMDWIISGLVKSGMLNLEADRGSANIFAIQSQGERQVYHRSSFPSARSRDLEECQRTGGSTEDSPQVPFFEAYFIAPQSISRDLPDGVFGITNRPSGAYTTLMLDTNLDLPLLQAVLSEAESRGHPKSQTKRIERISKALPQAALKEIQWLSDLRREHSKEAEWDIVEIVKLAYHRIMVKKVDYQHRHVRRRLYGDI